MTTKDYLHEQLRQIADDVMDLEFALSEKRRNRDALIVSARVAGLSLRAIGDACMISHQTVQNIVNRATALGACTVVDPTDETTARAAGSVPTTVDEPGRDE